VPGDVLAPPAPADPKEVYMAKTSSTLHQPARTETPDTPANAEVIDLRPSTPGRAEDIKLLLAQLAEVTDRVRRVQNTLGGVAADPHKVYTEEDASRACSDCVNLFAGRHGWQTQLARATAGEIPAAKAMRSIERFRRDLNWRRYWAVQSVLEVGMQSRGDWVSIKQLAFQGNVDRLLELERSWAPLAAALEAELDEAEQLLGSLVTADSASAS